MKYRLEVTYAAGSTQLFENLTVEQAEQAVGAFSSDLFHLEGRGITRFTVEVVKS